MKNLLEWKVLFRNCRSKAHSVTLVNVWAIIYFYGGVKKFDDFTNYLLYRYCISKCHERTKLHSAPALLMKHEKIVVELTGWHVHLYNIRYDESDT